MLETSRAELNFRALQKEVQKISGIPTSERRDMLLDEVKAEIAHELNKNYTKKSKLREQTSKDTPTIQEFELINKKLVRLLQEVDMFEITADIYTKAKVITGMSNGNGHGESVGHIPEAELDRVAGGESEKKEDQAYVTLSSKLNEMPDDIPDEMIDEPAQPTNGEKGSLEEEGPQYLLKDKYDLSEQEREYYHTTREKLVAISTALLSRKKDAFGKSKSVLLHECYGLVEGLLEQLEENGMTGGVGLNYDYTKLKEAHSACTVGDSLSVQQISLHRHKLTMHAREILELICNEYTWVKKRKEQEQPVS